MNNPRFSKFLCYLTLFLTMAFCSFTHPLCATAGVPISAPKGFRRIIPIFPGAEGYGTHTRAAYGGTGNPTIYIVDELADNTTA